MSKQKVKRTRDPRLREDDEEKNMSKQYVKQTALEKEIMKKIRSNKVQMKPRWYFVLGSLFMFVGIVGASVLAIFLTTVTMFLLRQHGPRGAQRYQMLIDTFPWWVPILAIIGIIGGVLLLKKYEFSYKKNFVGVIITFIIAIIAVAFAIDALGLNDFWSRQGYGRGFYRQFNMQQYEDKGLGRNYMMQQNGRGLNHRNSL